MTATKEPPEISTGRLLFDYWKIRKQTLAYLLSLQRRYGDTVKLNLGVPTFLLNEPLDIRHILMTNPSNYLKTGGLTFGKALFGKGLLSSDGELHDRQRKTIQPMFHKHKLIQFSETITATALEHVADWKENTTLDIAYEMMNLTLRIVGKTLLSVELSDHLHDLGQTVTISQRYITRVVWRPIRLPRPKWSPAYKKYSMAIQKLDRIIYSLIDEHRREPARTQDILTMLLEARYDDGTSMGDQQIRDEVATIIAAGHDTTAIALSWTWYLLSQHPECELRLVEELRQVLSGRTPTVSDIPNLRYTEMVLAESMRLYPPAWLLARKVHDRDTLPSGTVLPARSQIVILPYITHRNPKYFQNPDQFLPERFSDKTRQELQFVYIPFSVGPRGCIGEPFAKMEAVLLLAAIGQRYKLTLENNARVEPELVQTLRPKYGIHMRITHR